MTTMSYDLNGGNDGGKQMEDLKWQYIAAILASIATFATGTIIGWTSQISTQLLDGGLGFPISEGDLGWIASFNLLSAGVMALVAGSLSDLIGRKRLLLLLSVPLTASWILIYFATCVEMVYGGRLLSGMVGGANCTIFAVYANEIASKSIRGRLGSLNNLTLSFGMLFDAILGKYLSIPDYILVCACVPAVFVVGFLFMPESPVYLVKKGNYAQAKKSFEFLRGRQFDAGLIDEEINQLRESMNDDVKLSTSWKNLYVSVKSTVAGRRGMIILLILMSFRVFVGVDVVISYSSHIFQTAKMEFDPQLGTIFLMLIQVIVGLLQSSVVDKIGRRLLLLNSAIVIILCLSTVGTCLLLKEREIVEESYLIYSDYVLLIALGIFFVGYSIGLGPIPFLMVPEVFPVETKSTATALGIFITKICGFVVSRTFITIKSAGGQDLAFYAYAALTVVGGMLIYFKIPETKGKTIQDMLIILSKDSSTPGRRNNKVSPAEQITRREAY